MYKHSGGYLSAVVHLPMLADAGVINYDVNREVVELRDQGTNVVRYLDR